MLLSFLLATAQISETAPSYNEQAAEVANRIELGFKLCAKHIVHEGLLTNEDREELASLDVRMLEDVPDDVKANTGPIFTENRIFAKIGETGSNVYISTADKSFACRVIVSDTRAALKGRVDFVDKLRQTSAWTYDKRRSGTAHGMMKDELLINSGRMITIVNGPNHINNDGNGIQVFVTVALQPPKDSK